MKSTMYLKSLIIILALTFFSVSYEAHAEEGAKKGAMETPPLESVTACEGLFLNQDCVYTGKNGEVKGKCSKVQDQMVCLRVQK